MIEDMLRTLQEIRDRLSASGQPLSSVEIHDSTRGFDVDVKCYGASPETLLRDIGDAAMEEYVRIKLELARKVEDGFTAQVASMRNNSSKS